MAISLSSLRRTGAPKPPILTVYGPHGVGKTSLASQAPNPVFLQFEEGEGVLEFDAWKIDSFGDAIEALAALDSDDHDFKTVVLDTADWLQRLVWQQTCAKNRWADIETPGFGKGYTAADDTWHEVFSSLKYLRDERKMSVIILAHCEVKRFENPETDPYDRYQPKLQKNGSALLQEFCDGVFFANFRASTTKTEVAPKQTVTRGVGGGERLLYTEERPPYLAKNRWAMPPSLPLEWEAVAEFIPYFNPQAAKAAE